MCGTAEYVAPEVLEGKGYNHSADWFSFGALMYDMLTGKPPFYSKNKFQVLKNIRKKPIPMPEFLSTAAKSMLNELFKLNVLLI